MAFKFWKAGGAEVYSLVVIEDFVRIPPSKFDRPLEDAAIEELREKYEGRLISLESASGKKTAVFLAILNAKVDEYGIILPGDGATYHRAEFEAVIFSPFQKEVVEGEIVTVTRSGIYVNLGAADGFAHFSQIADEKIEFDAARGALALTESRKFIEKGDVVRAKVYQVAHMAGKGIRVALTLKQPGLGKKEWILSKQRGVT